MRNHGEKLKDIAESVLPSTRRESARQNRRAIHQEHRARQRDRLRAAALDPEAADVGPEIERRRNTAVTWMVADRRGADKIGTLLRWARARIDADPALADASLDEQVAAFRSLLPDNTIGRHALDHIRWDLQRRAGVGRFGHDAYGPAARGRARASARDRLAHQARRILANGLHGDLNDAIRAMLPPQEPDGPTRRPAGAGPGHRCPRRYLLGADDVHAFADAVCHCSHYRDVVARVAASGAPARS